MEDYINKLINKHKVNSWYFLGSLYTRMEYYWVDFLLISTISKNSHNSINMTCRKRLLFNFPPNTCMFNHEGQHIKVHNICVNLTSAGNYQLILYPISKLFDSDMLFLKDFIKIEKNISIFKEFTNLQI